MRRKKGGVVTLEKEGSFSHRGGQAMEECVKIKAVLIGLGGRTFPLSGKPEFN